MQGTGSGGGVIGAWELRLTFAGDWQDAEKGHDKTSTTAGQHPRGTGDTSRSRICRFSSSSASALCIWCCSAVSSHDTRSAVRRASSFLNVSTSTSKRRRASASTSPHLSAAAFNKSSASLSALTAAPPLACSLVPRSLPLSAQAEARPESQPLPPLSPCTVSPRPIRSPSPPSAAFTRA